MNKTELTAALAEKAGFKKNEAEKALNAFVDVVTEALSNGNRVQIVGFGSFEVKDRPERVARNPQAPDQEITIPASVTEIPQGLFYCCENLKKVCFEVPPVSIGSFAFAGRRFNL